MKKVIVKLENVSKSYIEGKTIIDNISLEVYEGEFLTFLGSSGCGKTTTLRMISGLEHVSKGKVFINNVDVTDIESTKRPVNTIFQNFALFPNMTVAQNIGYGLKMKHLPKDVIAKKVKKMLEMVQLEGYQDRYPHQLSGGEQQRVAIARGLANEPDVLLLDEPLSALDLKLKKQMMLELKRLQKHLKTTFIYVTHAQDEAITMSDRIFIFKDGHIVQSGTPKEIYDHPVSTFVADFIGDSAMIKGKVVTVRGGKAYVLFDKDTEIPIANESLHAGQDVTLVIRPEKVRVKDENKKKYIKATVKEAIYNGSFIRLNASYQNKEIKVNVDITDDREFHKGDIVYLEIDEDTHVLVSGENHE